MNPEELDDKEKVGADPAAQPQPTEAGDSQTGSQPRPGTRKGLGQRLFGGEPKGILGQIASFVSYRRKLIIGLGIGSAIIVLLVSVLLPFILAYKLVHIVENITDFFDKRHRHAIDRRVGKHYVAAFNDKGEHVGFEHAQSGNPIKDAYANYKINRAVKDFEGKGYKAVFSDANGKWIALIDPGGQRIDLSEKNLKDRRSVIRTELRTNNPELGFFRRNLRARQLDARFGVKRRFLENRREKINDRLIQIERDMIKKIRERVFGSDSGGRFERGQQNPDATEEQKKQQAKEIGATDELYDKAQADSGELLADPNNKEKIDVSSPDGVGSKLTRGLSIFGVLNSGCYIKNLLNIIRGGARIMREAALIRFAFTTIPTADQAKRGDLHSKQFSVFMKRLSGFEKSGGWQRITGRNKNATVNADKYSLDGRKGKRLSEISSKVDGQVSNSVCGVVNNVFVQGIGIIGTGIAAFFSGGTSLFVQAGTAGAVTGLTVAAEKILLPIAVATIAGTVVTGDEDPDEVADATIAGYDAYSNENGRMNGGKTLSKAEVASIDSAIALEDQQDAAQKGIAYQLFSPDYSKSLASQLVMAAPTSGSEALGKGSQLIASTNLFAWAQKLFGRNTSTAALAEDGDADPSGFGMTQYGITDDLSDKYPDPQANEEWIRAHIGTALGEDLNSEDGDDEYHKFVRDCLTSQDPQKFDKGDCISHEEKFERFRVYRFDTGIANAVNSYSNNEDDQDDGSDEASTTEAESSGDLVTGPSKELAQQILANNDVHKIGRLVQQDLEAAAAGRAASAGVPLKQSLLALIATMAQHHTFNITALESGGSGHTAGSAHYSGAAVDITGLDGDPIAETGIGRTSNDRKLIQEIAPLMPSGSGFGQSTCGPSVSLPSGINQFEDSCNHLHIQVPK